MFTHSHNDLLYPNTTSCSNRTIGRYRTISKKYQQKRLRTRNDEEILIQDCQDVGKGLEIPIAVGSLVDGYGDLIGTWGVTVSHSFNTLRLVFPQHEVLSFPS